MKNIKKYGIIALILVFIIAFAVVPLLKTKSSENETDESLARFVIEDNISTTFGNTIPITFEVGNKDVVKIELYFEDSIIETWKNPKGKLTYNFNTNLCSLGAYEISLKSTLSSNDTYSDVRLFQILSNVSPTPRKAKIVASYPHNEKHFTQGLEFNNGILYEGTGDPTGEGLTKLMQINFSKGSIEKEIGLDGNYFGEGISILGDKVYQLTYKEQKCFVYDKNTLQVEKDFSYVGEGWGLCNNGKQLIMSNGSEYLTFRNPETFQVEKTIQVYDQVGPRVKLNELEYVDGKIYANVWMLDLILVIDPVNGKILEEIDCSELSKQVKGAVDVLNGIAYHPTTKKFFLTGKYWPKMFEVVFE